MVTLNYYSYQDSSANEPITKNGTLNVIINAPDPRHPRMVTRVIEFHNFEVATDSTIVIINGTRIVERQKDTIIFNGLQSASIAVTDNVSASLNYEVFANGRTDTFTYTRNVSRVRTIISYFRNVNFIASDSLYSLAHMRFRHVPSFDTLSYTGMVNGLNEKGNTYAKAVNSPLDILVYKGSLVIYSGIITYTTSARRMISCIIPTGAFSTTAHSCFREGS